MRKILTIIIAVFYAGSQPAYALRQPSYLNGISLSDTTTSRSNSDSKPIEFNGRTYKPNSNGILMPDIKIVIPENINIQSELAKCEDLFTRPNFIKMHTDDQIRILDTLIQLYYFNEKSNPDFKYIISVLIKSDVYEVRKRLKQLLLFSSSPDDYERRDIFSLLKSAIDHSHKEFKMLKTENEVDDELTKQLIECMVKDLQALSLEEFILVCKAIELQKEKIFKELPDFLEKTTFGMEREYSHIFKIPGIIKKYDYFMPVKSKEMANNLKKALELCLKDSPIWTVEEEAQGVEPNERGYRDIDEYYTAEVNTCVLNEGAGKPSWRELEEGMKILNTFMLQYEPMLYREENGAETRLINTMHIHIGCPNAYDLKAQDAFGFIIKAAEELIVLLTSAIELKSEECPAPIQNLLKGKKGHLKKNSLAYIDIEKNTMAFNGFRPQEISENQFYYLQQTIIFAMMIAHLTQRHPEKCSVFYWGMPALNKGEFDLTKEKAIRRAIDIIYEEAPELKVGLIKLLCKNGYLNRLTKDIVKPKHENASLKELFQNCGLDEYYALLNQYQPAEAMQLFIEKIPSLPEKTLKILGDYLSTNYYYLSQLQPKLLKAVPKQYFDDLLLYNVINLASKIKHDAHGLAISPNADMITLNYKDNMVEVVDAETGLIMSGPFGVAPGWVRKIFFSPDARKIIVRIDQKVQTLDAKTGDIITDIPFPKTKASVRAIGISPHGDKVALAYYNGVTKIVSAEKRRVIKISNQLSADYWDANEIVFSKGATKLAILYNYKIVIIADTKTGNILQAFDNHNLPQVIKMSFSDDGNEINLCTFTGIKIFDVTTKEIVADLTIPKKLKAMDKYARLAVNANKLAIACYNSVKDSTELIIFDRKTKKKKRYLIPDFCAYYINFSQNAETIALVSSSASAKIVDTETGGTLISILNEEPRDIYKQRWPMEAVFSDSNIIIAREDGLIKVLKFKDFIKTSLSDGSDFIKEKFVKGKSDAQGGFTELGPAIKIDNSKKIHEIILTSA
ncbi:MAG: hypothetical protein V2A72_03460 [Candidatus Omnitrophota bacterium]